MIRRVLILTLIFSSSFPVLADLKKPRILFVSAERLNVLKTGGLGDAVDGLANALKATGTDVTVLTPYYRSTDHALKAKGIQVTDLDSFKVPLDRQNGQFQKEAYFSLKQIPLDEGGKKARYFALDHHAPFGTWGYFENLRDDKKITYGPDYLSGEAWGAFSKAAADMALKVGYDFVVVNDWTTGLVPVFLKEAKRAHKKVPFVIGAIHNMGYQGIFPKSLVDYLGLNWKDYNALDGFEFYDKLSMLKAMLLYSDLVYTVSPTYGLEIGTKRFGENLEGVIKSLQEQWRTTGILNGMDVAEWDPSLPKPGVEHTFSISNMEPKKVGKAEMQKALGLPEKADVPVIAMTSRLAGQKGYDYLPDAIETIVKEKDVQFVIIGDGDERYSQRLRELQKAYPDKIHFGSFDAAKEKTLISYSDFFLTAPWYEPSGLNQFYAMITGTVPIVSRVGGLKDSVKNGETGYLFNIVEDSYDPKRTNIRKTQSEIVEAVLRAINTYVQRPEVHAQMRLNAMKENNSWHTRAEEFLAILDILEANGPAILREARPGKGSAGLSPTEILTILRKELKARDRVVQRKVPGGMDCHLLSGHVRGHMGF